MLPARALPSPRMHWRNRRRVRRRASGRSHYNLARDYDPAIGRYVESDPIGLDGGTNTYAYAEDKPTSNVDPSGRYDCTYSISLHQMNCTPSFPGDPSFSSSNYVTGNNNIPGPAPCNCQNNPSASPFPFHGPLPIGDYTIGRQRAGSSRRSLAPDSATAALGRDSFQLHGCSDPSRCSDGCVAATTNKTRDTLNNLLHREEGANRLHVVF
jgi:RHS repeat-associated protein